MQSTRKRLENSTSREKNSHRSKDPRKPPFRTCPLRHPPPPPPRRCRPPLPQEQRSSPPHRRRRRHRRFPPCRSRRPQHPLPRRPRRPPGRPPHPRPPPGSLLLLLLLPPSVGEWTVVQNKRATKSPKKTAPPALTVDQRSFELVLTRLTRLLSLVVENIITAVNRALHRETIQDVRVERLRCTDTGRIIGITSPISTL